MDLESLELPAMPCRFSMDSSAWLQAEGHHVAGCKDPVTVTSLPGTCKAKETFVHAVSCNDPRTPAVKVRSSPPQLYNWPLFGRCAHVTYTLFFLTDLGFFCQKARASHLSRNRFPD